MKRLLLCTVLFLLLAFPHVEGTAIGVSKALIHIDDVLKNGYAEEQVYVSTDSVENLSLVYEAEGEIKPWISVKEEGELYISRDHGQWVTFVVSPPADVANGMYTGLIRVRTGVLSTDIKGRIGSTIIVSFAIQTEIGITGQELISCIPGGFRIPDTEEGKPVEFRFSVLNQGNVRITPEAKLDFWDREHAVKVASVTVTGEEVLPTISVDTFQAIPGLELSKGQYFVNVTVPLCAQPAEEITFEVLEKGGISDRGDLMRIENQYYGRVGQITPIKAIFKNSGERAVSAKFKGTIRSANVVVKLIETDNLDVLPGEIVDFESFFTPEKEGKYEIFGRVLYNNKLTFEKASLLEAFPADVGLEKEVERRRISSWSFVPIIIVLVAIMLLVVLIKRKRKKKAKRIIS
ncbi:MAG: hypothetical protein ABIJ21_03770 [Nanoarchaeota archaeon]